MASTISVAPVPGVGFSIRCSGVGPSIMPRRKPSSSSATACARSAGADEREVAEQIVADQFAGGGDLRGVGRAGIGGSSKPGAGT